MSSDPNLASGVEARSQSSLSSVRDPNEVITQLLEHIVTLKMVSGGRGGREGRERGREGEREGGRDGRGGEGEREGR